MWLQTIKQITEILSILLDFHVFNFFFLLSLLIKYVNNKLFGKWFYISCRYKTVFNTVANDTLPNKIWPAGVPYVNRCLCLFHKTWYLCGVAHRSNSWTNWANILWSSSIFFHVSPKRSVLVAQPACGVILKKIKGNYFGKSICNCFVTVLKLLVYKYCSFILKCRI